MKGYVTKSGYMGWTGLRYILFDTEGEYISWYRENFEET